MSKSVLTVGDIPVSYVDATGMTVLDYVGFSVSTAVLVGYHVWHEYATHSKLHSSVTSHVEFSRMSWTKNIYYDYKNRVTTIQSFRSALGIIRFYLSLILFAVLTIGRAAVSLNWWAALRGPIPLVAARTIVPFTIFMVSAAQFLLCLQTLYYLHFHTQVEDLDHAEREQFGIADIATDVTEQRIKACSAVLAMQSNIHFRIAWRTMVYGFVFTLWSVSPVLLMVASVLLTMSLYINDFPFSSSWVTAPELHVRTNKVVPVASQAAVIETVGGATNEIRGRSHEPFEYPAASPVRSSSALLLKRQEIAAVFRSLPT